MLKVWRHNDNVMCLSILKFLECVLFLMRRKEHTKGSWNLKKFYRYHKNWMSYGIFNFE